MFDLHFWVLGLHEGKSGQELGQSPSSRRIGAWHCGVLLLSWSAGLLSRLYRTAQAHLLRDGSTHVGFGLPKSINQGNSPQTWSQTHRICATPPLRFSLPRCVQLTIKTNEHSTLLLNTIAKTYYIVDLYGGVTFQDENWVPASSFLRIELITQKERFPNLGRRYLSDHHSSPQP